MADETEVPSNVFNMRGLRLYPHSANVNAITVETLDSQTIALYGEFKPCGVCKGQGWLHALNSLTGKIGPVPCSGCNGFGYLMKFLQKEERTNLNVAPQKEETDPPTCG